MGLTTIRSTDRGSDKVRADDGVAVVTGYDYGAPAGSGGDGSGTGVELQWIFDAASGNITDGVNSVVLTATGGVLTYNQTASGDWSNLSPGIAGDGTSANFYKATATTQADVAASEDYVIEWVADVVGWPASARYSWSFLGNTGNYGHMITLNPATDEAKVTTYADGFAHYKLNTYSIGTDWRDGNLHKWWLSFDRDGNQELKIDGSSKGTFDISANAAGVYTNEGIRLMGQYNGGGNDHYGSLYEFRMTVGNATNDSGGGD